MLSWLLEKRTVPDKPSRVAQTLSTWLLQISFGEVVCRESQSDCYKRYLHTRESRKEKGVRRCGESVKQERRTRKRRDVNSILHLKMNTLHHQSVRDLRGRLKWQEAKVSSLREKCSQLSESESPAEYGALCSRLEQERLLLGALQICVTLMDDGKEAESSDPRQRRRSLALVKEKSETNNNARRGRSYTAAGVAPQQELDEIEFFGAQQRAMMALDDCVRDLQQRTYGWTVTVPSQSNNSATDTDSQATDHYEGDSTTETEFAEDRVVSSSLEDTDTDTGMLRRDSTLEALDLSATQTSSTNNSNSSNDSNNQRKHRRVTSSMGMKSEKRGKRRSLKHTLSQFLSAGTQGGQGGGAGSDTPLGTHRKLHLSKDLSIGSAITLAELNKGTGESGKSEYLGENVLRERLNESNARDDLRKALTDIKRKILACEQRVKTLQNKLKKMPKENDDWRATKVELDEQKMLLTALQINVMVFKRYTNGEDAVEPSSRSSSGVSSSPRSLLDASLSPRGLHAHRTTGGGRKGTLLQGILPGLERERNPSIARSASSVQGFFASSIPSMRPRVTYDSDTSRSDVILQSGSFSSCCKVSMDSRELETGTLRDIITWTLMLSDRTMADNADLEALLLFCHSAFVPDDLLITLMEVWEHFEDTSFPEEFGAGGMRKRLVNFIGQVLRTVHISIPVDVRRAMLDMCESHIDTQDHKHLTGLVEREQEPLHHVRGVEDALERTTVEPDFDFLRHSPSALARELSVLMSDALFCLGQRLTEFIDMRWMQTPPVNAPLIARVTDMFNRLQRFVVHSILVVSSPKQQVAVIKHWLKTADECLSAHSDINSVATILAGLTDIAISRLKKYKSLLADRHVQTFQRLEKHISSKDNFREYRESLSSSSSLPFLAVHLRDLAYLEEANQTKILRRETTGALEVLSFERMRKFRSMILSMHLHTLGQDTPLPVPWNPSLLASLATVKT